MKTHTDVTIWLEGSPTVDVRLTDGCAWAWVDGTVTIHSGEGKTGLEDLDCLEAFFRSGLDAILKVRNPSLFDKLARAEVVK